MDDMLSRIRSMSQDKRASLIRTIRREYPGDVNDVEFADIDIPRVLTYLGETDQRKKAIERFRRIRFYYSELVDLGEPWVIEELAQELFRNEEFANFLDGDIINYPLSYAVSGLIIANLQHATIYSDDVLEWAKRTSPYALPELRAAIRDWWRENERFFKEKNYKSVRPGREVTNFATSPPAAPSLPGPRADGAVSPDNTPLAATEVRHGVEPSHPSMISLGIGVIGIAGLIGGLLFFLKSRSR